jgi:secondary thiamine-phosphate synthase enzyme
VSTELIQSAGLLARRQSLLVSSESRQQVIDITRQVRESVFDSGVVGGMALVNVLHTTCSMIIAETGDRTSHDFFGLMSRFIEDGAPYRHNDPRWSDCERGNAAAHLRASLLAHGVAVAIAGGELVLDGSQAILLAEWDGPRSRTINIQILGAESAQ